MTIEHATSTNGHLKHDDPVRTEPTPLAQRATGDDARPQSRTRRLSLARDLRGIALSAVVAAGVVLALRRLDRRASD